MGKRSFLFRRNGTFYDRRVYPLDVQKKLGRREPVVPQFEFLDL